MKGFGNIAIIGEYVEHLIYLSVIIEFETTS